MTTTANNNNNYNNNEDNNNNDNKNNIINDNKDDKLKDKCRKGYTTAAPSNLQKATKALLSPSPVR